MACPIDHRMTSHDYVVYSEGLYDEHPDFMDYYERFIGNSAANGGGLRIPKNPSPNSVALVNWKKETIENWTRDSGTAGIN